MYMPIPMPTPAATAATVVDAIRAVDASFIVPAPPRVWLSDYYLAFLKKMRDQLS
jgi:MinD superfamily P-loop ATPase